MSRGVKDLRELICVSRLAIVDSDDDDEARELDTDHLSGGRSSRSSGSLSAGVGTSQARNDGHATRLQRPTSGGVDSGIWTIGSGCDKESDDSSDVKSLHITNTGQSRRRKKKHRFKRSEKLLSASHDLPKHYLPLPPVHKAGVDSPAVISNGHCPREPSEDLPDASDEFSDGNFDWLLSGIDGAVVSDWLERANQDVSNMAVWCRSGENFVQFAHFWLSEFPEQRKIDVFALEYNLLMDQLTFAFASFSTKTPSNGRRVHDGHLLTLLRAVLREYPERLLGPKGAHMFLDYLDILSSGKHDIYRLLLSDVKCCTDIRQHAQWILALRASALVSVWIAVLDFYRKSIKGEGSTMHRDAPPVVGGDSTKVNQARMYQAIRFVIFCNFTS